MNVYTRTGDDGSTGLFHGGRVDKDDLRTEAYGTTDEAVSALGLARSQTRDARWAEAILLVQRELFVLGAQLATDAARWGTLEVGVSRVDDAMVADLERRIDALLERHPLPQAFIVPGDSTVGAALDLARTIVRRAERAIVAMLRADLLPDDAPLRWCNRLSDYLFVLARAVEGGDGTRSRV